MLNKYILDIVILIYTVIMLFILIKYTSKATYKYDKDDRFIYYPNGCKKGYVVNDKSLIDKMYKSYWKCFVLNIKGFYDDINKLFSECEVVNEPLPFDTRMKNLAKVYPWWVLLFVFVSNCGLATYFYLTNKSMIALIFLPLTILTFKQILIKMKNN